jgi:uncharacterized glyoxalase superfamily protein PhnB
MNKLVPYIRCTPAAAAIDFYTRVFGAQEVYRLTDPEGRIGHAELQIDGQWLYLSDAYPEYDCLAPTKDGDTFVSLHLVVENVDALVETARQHGAKFASEPKDEFYGYRGAIVIDPFGHRWMLNQLLVEMSIGEIQQKFNELYGKPTT